MKDLLFLVHRIPYPPNKGDKIRSFHLLQHLATIYKVHLGTFIDDANDCQYTDTVDGLCASTCYQMLNPLYAKIGSVTGLLAGEALSLPYYKNKAMQDSVDNTLQTHAIKKVLIFSSVMGQFIKPGHAVEMAVDFVDVDSDKWRQYAEKKHGMAKWVYQREAKYLLAYERALAAKAKVSFFVSEQEAALFKKLAPEVSAKVSHINNGVNVAYFSPEHPFDSPYPDHEAEPILVFVGAMDYWANVDAVVWFAQQVLPQVVTRYPNVKFYIVGSKPTKDVLALAGANVVVTGAVPDVRPYVAYARLAVAPLRIARGIQNKVLEAMAMAKQVVATSAAMEGIPVNSALAVEVSDEAGAMAQQINGLLAQGVPPSSNNREYVQSQFGWKKSLDGLVGLLEA